MKKTICMLILLIIITGCSKNHSITSSKFKDIVRSNNFYVVDSKEQFSDYDYIKEALIAIEDDKKYQIEFYVLEDVKNAVAFYNLNKKTLEASEDDSSISHITDSKYVLTTQDSYKVISIIDDTVIYIDVDKVNKKSVDNILKKLGY